MGSDGPGAPPSPASGARSSSVSGVDPRTLSTERLAHLKTFQEYRVTWDEVARVGTNPSRKISLSAPIGGAESPRPPQEWANAIVAELQAINDKVADLRRGIPRRDEKEIEKVALKAGDEVGLVGGPHARTYVRACLWLTIF